MHVSGSALGDAGMATKVLRVCKALHGKGVAISFDPNVRKELIGNPAYFARRARDHRHGVDLPAERGRRATLFPGRGLEDYRSGTVRQRARAPWCLKKGDKGCEGVDAATASARASPRTK